MSILSRKKEIKEAFDNLKDKDVFFVNRCQTNHYYPIEKWILIGDKYYNCYYKYSAWKCCNWVSRDKMPDYLFSRYYSIVGLPTNSFRVAASNTNGNDALCKNPGVTRFMGGVELETD